MHKLKDKVMRKMPSNLKIMRRAYLTKMNVSKQHFGYSSFF